MSNVTVKKILREAGFQAHFMDAIVEGATPEARDVREIFIKMIEAGLKFAKRN